MKSISFEPPLKPQLHTKISIQNEGNVVGWVVVEVVEVMVVTESNMCSRLGVAGSRRGTTLFSSLSWAWTDYKMIIITIITQLTDVLTYT